MATIILEVNQNIVPDNWQLISGNSKVEAVQLPVSDNTYLGSGLVQNTLQLFELFGAELPETAIIDSVAVKARLKTTGHQKAVCGIWLIYSDGFLATNKEAKINWGEVSQRFLTKYDGSSWTPTDLNGLKLQILNAQKREVLCSSLWAEVDYHE